jgi:hypothetical protein
VGSVEHNVMAGPSVVRGGLLTAIVPEGPALVYSPIRTVGIRESCGKYRPQIDPRLANVVLHGFNAVAELKGIAHADNVRRPDKFSTASTPWPN